MFTHPSPIKHSYEIIANPDEAYGRNKPDVGCMLATQMAKILAPDSLGIVGQ